MSKLNLLAVLFLAATLSACAEGTVPDRFADDDDDDQSSLRDDDEDASGQPTGADPSNNKGGNNNGGGANPPPGGNPAPPPPPPPPPGGDMFNTYAECANYYCDQDPLGCDALLNYQFNYLYCGTSCGFDCGAFCADPSLTPSASCDFCVDNLNPNGNDVLNFQNACSSNSSCVNFANQLATCPE